MTTTDGQWHAAAALSDLTDPGSRSFRIETGPVPVFGFVVLRGGQLSGYENVCPHAGRMLNRGPHRFLTDDGSMIVCGAHGAMFDIASGECAAGPCVGESLRPIPLRVDGDTIEADISSAGSL